MPHAVLARMRLGGIAVLLVAMTSVANARPVTFGVGAGVIDAEQDWDDQSDDTLQVFGRIGLTARVSGQLELQKIAASQNESVTRTGTALLVVELGRSGRLVPTMFAGLGIDHGENPYGGAESGSHIEGGFGLEYRLDGGLVLMGDVRLGGRSVDQSDTVILDSPMAIYAPILIEGEYRSARIGVALRF
jgi:hypothetical protein